MHAAETLWIKMARSVLTTLGGIVPRITTTHQRFCMNPSLQPLFGGPALAGLTKVMIAWVVLL